MIRIAAGAALFATTAFAQQATFKGQVLTDSTERPIPGVTITIDLLKLSVISDSLGEFTINGITPGTHLVSARRIGFSPLTTRVTFLLGAVVEADLMMIPTAAQTLPDVKVEAKAVVHGKLGEFEERRLAGNGGRFLTQADLEKRVFSTLTDALRQMPGIDFIRNPRQMGESYAVTGRMSQPAGALAPAMQGGGTLQPCMAAVVLDGSMVYGAGAQGERPFNVNQIPANTIAGIEYYVGPASMPAKWNAARHTCGLLVIWTK
jgi:hypothetical protein